MKKPTTIKKNNNKNKIFVRGKKKYKCQKKKKMAEVGRPVSRAAMFLCSCDGRSGAGRARGAPGYPAWRPPSSATSPAPWTPPAKPGEEAGSLSWPSLRQWSKWCSILGARQPIWWRSRLGCLATPPPINRLWCSLLGTKYWVFYQQTIELSPPTQNTFHFAYPHWNSLIILPLSISHSLIFSLFIKYSVECLSCAKN